MVVVDDAVADPVYEPRTGAPVESNRGTFLGLALTKESAVLVNVDPTGYAPGSGITR